MENPYQAPEANLYTEEKFDEPLHFIVSQRKLWVLNVATLGLYSLVWHYYHWRYIKYTDKAAATIWPLARTVFSIFFVYSLFVRFSKTCEHQNRQYAWPHSLYAAIYIVLEIISYGYDRIPMEYFSVTSQTSIAIVSAAFVLGATFCMSKAQEAANVAVGDLAGDANSGFTAANIIWILIGCLLWALLLTPEWLLFPE